VHERGQREDGRLDEHDAGRQAASVYRLRALLGGDEHRHQARRIVPAGSWCGGLAVQVERFEREHGDVCLRQRLARLSLDPDSEFRSVTGTVELMTGTGAAAAAEQASVPACWRRVISGIHRPRETACSQARPSGRPFPGPP